MTQVSDPAQKRERPRYPLSKAAEMTGVSLSTIKRKRAAGLFPNAVQDVHGAWLIPVEDLLAAGLHLNSVTQLKHPMAQVSGPGQPIVTQASELGQLERIAQLERQLQVEIMARKDEHAGRMIAEQLAAEKDRLIESERKRADALEYVIRHQLTAGPPPVAPEISLDVDEHQDVVLPVREHLPAGRHSAAPPDEVTTTEPVTGAEPAAAAALPKRRRWWQRSY